MIYLIFGEKFSGVIAGQALDTCTFLVRSSGKNIKPIVLLPLRGIWEQRKQYIKYAPNVIILPMFLGSRFSFFYSLMLDFLSFFIPMDQCIGRGVKASHIALNSKRIKRVIYDGRGAHSAEYQEYFMEQYNLRDKDVKKAWSMEKNVVIQSHYRIAVSNALVKYWKEEFGYNDDQYSIIPCTLNKVFYSVYPSSEELESKRKALGFSKEDIILVYSGSTAGWQSFSLIDEFLHNLIKHHPLFKVLILSKIDLNSSKILNEFPTHVKQAWLPIEEVYSTIAVADYGLLFRDTTITNKVSSPVKFAEYLAAGLKVIISSNVGDYSAFVAENKLGFVFKNQDIKDINFNINKNNYSEKQRINKIALKNFTKDSYLSSYLKVIEF